jgi:hypothetical protein
MTNQKGDVGIVSLSVQIYQMLLAAYPIGFQTEYGPQMEQVFQDKCREAYANGRIVGILLVWPPTLFDLITTVIKEHASEGFHMSKANIRRIGGASAILGGTLTATFLFGLPVIAFIIPLLFIGGLIGLSVVNPSGKLGRMSLALGVFGAVTMTAGLALQVLVSKGDPESPFLRLFLAGFFLLGVGQVLYGIYCLQTKPLPRGNFIPLQAGLLCIASLFYLSLPILWALIVMLFGVSWIMLGAILLISPRTNVKSIGRRHARNISTKLRDEGQLWVSNLPSVFNTALINLTRRDGLNLEGKAVRISGATALLGGLLILLITPIGISQENPTHQYAAAALVRCTGGRVHSSPKGKI